jgi:hypothetical protein
MQQADHFRAQLAVVTARAVYECSLIGSRKVEDGVEYGINAAKPVGRRRTHSVLQF